MKTVYEQIIDAMHNKFDAFRNKEFDTFLDSNAETLTHLEKRFIITICLLRCALHKKDEK